MRHNSGRVGMGRRLWMALLRRGATTCGAVGVALFVLLVVGTLGAVGLSVHAFQSSSPQQQSLRAPKPDPKAAGAYFQMMHIGRSHPAPNARANALAQAARMPVSPLSQPAQQVSGATSPHMGTETPGTWSPLGPEPVNSDYNCTNPSDPSTCLSNDTGPNSGRVTAIAVNPSNNNDVWLGAADGGLWHSTDGGSTWSSVDVVGSNETLAIGSITIDPNAGTPYTIFVGTGEGNLNGDAYWGEGIFKSSNGGATWSQSGFSDFAGMAVDKIAVNPTNSNDVLTAVTFAGYTTPSGGPNPFSGASIYQSLDGGSTWTIVHGQGGSAVGGTDVIFDPSDPTGNTVYAGLGDFGLLLQSNAGGFDGVYKSTDGGANWLLQANFPWSVEIERVSLAAAHGHVYAIASDGAGNLWQGKIYETSDGGNTWTAIDVAANGAPEMVDDDGQHQWWYDSVAMADPTDSTGQTLYVGGADLWKTTDAGKTWTNLTNAFLTPGVSTPYAKVYAYQHAFAFFAPRSTQPGSFYLGNDGGVWSGTGGTGTSSFTNLNGGGLNITQFYGGSIGEVGTGTQLYGGSQDNGEVTLPLGATTPGQWNELVGANGGDTAVDYTNNQIVYGEFPNGYVYKTSDGGATWNAADSGINHTDPVNYIMPLVMSPSNHTELFAGTDRVYRTTNGAASWSAVSPSFTDPSNKYDSTISSVAVAPSNDAYIYAGEFYGRVFVTTNGGGSWKAGSGICAYSTVTGIAVDPTNPSVAYATCAGFTGTNGGHIFKTTNAGASWTDVSFGLVDIPVESIVINPNNHNMVFAGSDAGIFVNSNGGSSGSLWLSLGGGYGTGGLPNVAVDQIFMNHTGTRLFVATHGMGMWEMTFPNITASTPAIEATTSPGVSPANQTLTIGNNGFGTLNWSTNSPLPSWLSLSPSSGALAAGQSQQLTVQFSIPPTDGPQTYSAPLVFNDPNAADAPLIVTVTVVATPGSKTWYFAEGYTGGNATEYLTLANPNPVAAHVSVKYLLGSGGPITKPYTVGANQRGTVIVNQDVGPNQNVSMVVTADQPIVAERPYYVTYTGFIGHVSSGTDVLGATSLATQFDFAYLDTSAHHETWLTILNPNNTAMTVTITYFAAAGASGPFGTPPTTIVSHTVPANSRGTVFVNGEAGLAPGVYSALVSLSEPGLVERPLYQTADSVTGYPGAADVVGVAQPLSTWYFAEGFTSPTVSERYILANPTSANGTVSATVTFYRADGSSVAEPVTLNPGQQVVVSANSVLGNNKVDNSAVVTADQPILAERLMSQQYVGYAGCCNAVIHAPGLSEVLGAAAPSHLMEFAEGYTGGQVAEYLTIENPSSTQVANVTVTFLPANGGAPVVKTYVVPWRSRFTLYTNSVMPNQWFAMTVESDQPVVAERPMSFIYNGWAPGSTDVIGYQPSGS